jgi:hypothetical protein
MSEQYYAEMEAARNTAVDAYFRARPALDAPLCRDTFRAGFERAFALLWTGPREIGPICMHDGYVGPSSECPHKDKHPPLPDRGAKVGCKKFEMRDGLGYCRNCGYHRDEHV